MTVHDTNYWKVLAATMQLRTMIAKGQWHAAYHAADQLDIQLGRQPPPGPTIDCLFHWPYRPKPQRRLTGPS